MFDITDLFLGFLMFILIGYLGLCLIGLPIMCHKTTVAKVKYMEQRGEKVDYWMALSIPDSYFYPGRAVNDINIAIKTNK